jgi:hypothetical protein
LGHNLSPRIIIYFWAYFFALYLPVSLLCKEFTIFVALTNLTYAVLNISFIINKPMKPNNVLDAAGGETDIELTFAIAIN